MISSADIKTMRKPFVVKLGFSKLIDQLEEMKASGSKVESELAACVLLKLEDRDALYDGLHDSSDFKDHIILISKYLFNVSFCYNKKMIF